MAGWQHAENGPEAQRTAGYLEAKKVAHVELRKIIEKQNLKNT